jgi:hypothetical protein
LLGIPADIPNHASYLASWMRALKNDKREIFRAAADAQRIADMALGVHPDYAASIQEQSAQEDESLSPRLGESQVSSPPPLSQPSRPRYARPPGRPPVP